jgi:CheY-like chemotaxis protein
VCQLHGGDIGVSSKEGEGSTFGFFFKVRQSDGTSQDGRPPFQSRTNSENSQQSNRPQTPQTPQAQRPGYSRANSNLTQIKERQNERPKPQTLTSRQGVDDEDMNESLRNPPTEYMAESHPESSSDNRYEVTEDIAKDIGPQRSTFNKSIEQQLPNLQRGETQRQEGAAENTSRSQSNQRADEKQTLLLVEDNLINQKVLRRQLQTRGFEVFTANNGQEAIDAVAERGQIPASNTTDRNFFDIILMDQGKLVRHLDVRPANYIPEMPIKDGNTATQEIRQLQDEGKAGYSHIIGVSANVREAQTRSMRDAGMDDIISKPFKVDDLVKRIRSIILEAPGKKHGENSPQPEDSGENKEVQMLEDLPIRSRSGLDRFEHGDLGANERGGRAKVEVNGEEREEQGEQEKQGKKGKHEEDENRDRRKGKAGKKSGREGELRGGERSRSRQTR